MSQLIISGGQSIGVSASASVPSVSIQDWYSFGIYWFDLLAVQGTFKSLLWHRNLRASILWPSVFFMVQLSHPYMTTGKTTALTRWTFVGKVMSLFFNMLSRFVTAFLPRSKHLLISWLHSLFVVILEPRKIKSATASISSLSICHEVVGPDAMILGFWMLSFVFFFLPVLGLHCCAWAFSSCCEWASHHHAFSCCRARALGIEGLHSCSGTGAQLPHGMWDPPRPGIKPVSLASQGRFLMTGPPEKPLNAEF